MKKLCILIIFALISCNVNKGIKQKTIIAPRFDKKHYKAPF